MLPTPRVASDFRVYEPAEDSFLLLDALESEQAYLLQRYTFPVVVEVGSGSGVVSAFVPSILPQATIVATDISQAACETTEKSVSPVSRSADVVRTDLCAALKFSSADILLCNPPYVPSEIVPERPSSDGEEKWLDLALDGGSDGMQVTWQLLDRLPTLLHPSGSAYILFCASNKPLEVAETMRDRGWDVHTIVERKAGWERLCVMRFQKSQDYRE